jgi:hypothetical protein
MGLGYGARIWGEMDELMLMGIGKISGVIKREGRGRLTSELYTH